MGEACVQRRGIYEDGLCRPVRGCVHYRATRHSSAIRYSSSSTNAEAPGLLPSSPLLACKAAARQVVAETIVRRSRCRAALILWYGPAIHCCCVLPAGLRRKGCSASHGIRRCERQIPLRDRTFARNWSVTACWPVPAFRQAQRGRSHTPANPTNSVSLHQLQQQNGMARLRRAS